jgi:hypothetical protein
MRNNGRAQRWLSSPRWVALAVLGLQVLLLHESLTATWPGLLQGRAGHARLFAAAATIVSCQGEGFGSIDCKVGVAKECGARIGFRCSDANNQICVCENSFDPHLSNFFRVATAVGTLCTKRETNPENYAVGSDGCTVPGQFCDQVRAIGALHMRAAAWACVVYTCVVCACVVCAYYMKYAAYPNLPNPAFLPLQSNVNRCICNLAPVGKFIAYIAPGHLEELQDCGMGYTTLAARAYMTKGMTPSGDWRIFASHLPTINLLSRTPPNDGVPSTSQSVMCVCQQRFIRTVSGDNSSPCTACPIHQYSDALVAGDTATCVVRAAGSYLQVVGWSPTTPTVRAFGRKAKERQARLPVGRG